MITVSLNFEANSLDSDAIIEIGRRVVTFTPAYSIFSWTSEDESMEFVDWAVLNDMISSQKPVKPFSIHNEHFDQSFGLSSNRQWTYELSWTQSEFRDSDRLAVESVVSHPNFHFAFASSEDSISLTTDSNRKSPGRTTPFPGMWLVAGWKNWYGSWSLQHLERNRLKDLPYLFEVRELPDEGLYIALSGAHDDPTLPAIQSRFWVDTGLEALESHYFSHTRRGVKSNAHAH